MKILSRILFVKLLLIVKTAMLLEDGVCVTRFVNGKFVRTGNCEEEKGEPQIIKDIRQNIARRENIPTCKELNKQKGIVASGNYTLGSANNQYEVYCNFTANEAITEIWHDSMKEVEMKKKCENIGCYSKIPRYTIGLNAIVNIIKNSKECRQYIKVRCKGMVIFRYGSTFAWWVSREGTKMNYWGGAKSRRDGYCACGETGTCNDNTYKCNCDRNDGSIRQDEGFLTDKTKLPVKELRFGDMKEPGEKGWHTLGPLECMG